MNKKINDLNKIQNIEFLRVLGCTAIIFLHFFHNKTFHKIFIDFEMYNHLYTVTSNGQKAVDLFFILSGVFFVLTLDTRKSMLAFVKKKLIRLWPVLIFTLGLALIFSAFGLIKFQTYNNIFALLGLSGTGLVLGTGNVGVFWYVSSMMWTLITLFYFIKNYEKKHVYLLVGCTIFFCYSFLIHAKGGKINHQTQTFYYVFNVGMMRAFAGIGIGYFIGEWYQHNCDKIQQFVPSLKAKIFITLIELSSLIFIIKYLFIKKIGYKNDVIFILAFTVLIILFLTNKGYVSNFFDKKIWVMLANYTYSFYMTHALFLAGLRNSVWSSHTELIMQYPIINIIATLALISVVGVFTYHYIEVPAKNYLTKLDREYYSKENQKYAGGR